MSGRHVLLLLAAAAVGLCVLLVVRALDGTDAVEEVQEAGPAEPAPLQAEAPPPVELRTEPEPAPSAPSTAPPAEVEPSPTVDAPDALDQAEDALRELTQLLRNARAPNEDVLQALARVLAFYLHPPRPPGVDAPDEGGALPTVPDQALRALAERQRWPREYLEEVLVLRRRAEKQFLRALALTKVDRERDVDLREEVNIAAAQALASTANAGLSRKMIKTLESSMLRAKHDVSQRLYDESFGALARLGSPDAFEWMREEFTHAKRSPEREVDRANAAHRAMVRFDRELVDGRERYAVVREMVRTYAGVESSAADGDADYADYWKRIGKDVIKVLQYHAFDPLDDEGEPLATLAAFQAWLREHKDPRKPPWKND